MKNVIILSLILILLSLAASGQRIRRPNIPTLSINRDTRLIAVQHYRLEKFRLLIARERIHRDGIITPMEKKRLKKINRHQRQRLTRARYYRLLS